MAILHFQRHLFHPVQNLLFLNVLSFIYLASNAFSDVGSVGRIEKKKKLKKFTRSLGIGGPGTPGRR